MMLEPYMIIAFLDPDFKFYFKFGREMVKKKLDVL